MKILFSSFILCIVFSTASAQNDYVVEYNDLIGVVSFQNPNPFKDYRNNCLLYTNGDSVAFFSIRRQKGKRNDKTIGSKKDHHSIFIFPKLKRSLDEDAYTRPFSLSEMELPPYNWKLNNDTMRIAGYVCYKAEENGLVAWYTNEIKIPFGPYIYTGLPGLILMLEDHIHNRLFKAISVRKHNYKIVLPELVLKTNPTVTTSKLDKIEAYFR